MLKYWASSVSITKTITESPNREADCTCTYRGIIGADGVATEDGVDPKALSGGVWVAVDVQDAALLEVVHVSSLHFQRA
jgi:hypothetical protein